MYICAPQKKLCYGYVIFATLKILTIELRLRLFQQMHSITYQFAQTKMEPPFISTHYSNWLALLNVTETLNFLPTQCILRALNVISE